MQKRSRVFYVGIFMTHRDRLLWSWRRLGRMSVLEVAHRMVEQLKRAVDRTRSSGWARFGDLYGDVSGLSGFELDEQIQGAFRVRLVEEAHAILCGRFHLLGQVWPVADSSGGPWWRTHFWLVDPVSRRSWPGAEVSAFDVSYRDYPARGDVKFVWELNRLQFLPPLALYARTTRDEAASRAVFDILSGWMAVNPPYRGVNWISGIEAASRVVSLLTCLSFLEPATPEDKAAVRVFLHAHIHWINRYPSRFSSANNHRVAELVAVFLAALCARDWPRSAKQKLKAQASLEREMRRQFHTDGVGAEQSIAYATYSLEWFTLAGSVGDAMGQAFSHRFKTRAGDALDYLSWTIDDVGRAPRIGDGDDGRVLALTQAPEPRYAASVAAMVARWLRKPNPSAAFCDLALRDLLGRPTTPAIAPTGMRTFKAGGMTVWRFGTANGGVVLTFDHGPLGFLAIAAHGHADALAVGLSWGDELIFVDPGTHLYHARRPTRNVLRGTAAHNTLTIAGEDQSRIIGPFAWADHARVRLIRASTTDVEAEHNGYKRRHGLIHRRRVCLDGDDILLEDRLIGRAKSDAIPWSIGFTLAPDLEAVVGGPIARIRTPAGRRITMTGESSDNSLLSWSLTSAPYAPAFGILQSTSRLELAGANWVKNGLVRIRITLEFGGSHQAKPS